MYEKENIDYKGMSVKIYYDEDAESPASWESEDVFLCSDYRELNVGSKILSPDDCREAISAGRSFANGYHVFPVRIYEHGGIVLSLGTCRGWDYSNGWAFICVKRMRGWSWRKSAAVARAYGLLQEWNEYLSGEVYGFQAEDENGRVIDSCWGYHGDPVVEDAISEGKRAIDAEIEARLRRHLARRKTEIRNHVPLYARAAYAR